MMKAETVLETSASFIHLPLPIAGEDFIEQANAVNERQTNEAFKTSYTVFSKRTPAEDTFPLLFQGQTISFPVVFALETVPWLKRLVDGLSSRRPGSIHLGIVVDKVALGQVFLRVLQFSFHRCSICIYHRPMRCAIAPTKHHIITTSVLS
jgi:hypothetical protein